MADALPAFLGPLTPLPAAPGPGALSLRAFGLDGGGGGPTVVAGFQMQSQGSQTNWCWAATGTSIARFYDQASTLTQCALATNLFSSQGFGLQCCGLDAAACNQQKSLTDVLTLTGNLRGNPIQPSISFRDLCQEIENQKPVAVRIAWPLPPNGPGGGHFIAVTGYQVGPDGSPYVVVQDPASGDDPIASKTIPLSELTENYDLAQGTWSYTYETQAAGG